MSIFNEHQYLLMRRESRVVLGRRAVNLWLLVLVLTATFFSIAFSAGSMDYLQEKMNDPFTNWVNINRDASLEKIGILKMELDKDSIRQHFLFDGVQTESEASLDMISPSGKQPLFSILYYEDMGSDLIHAVLSEENVIKGNSIEPDSISATSFGVIMTVDALAHLGYDIDHVPAYVDVARQALGADTLGYELLDGGYVRAPIPLLAVVKRLPMNKEMVASQYFLKQYNDASMGDSRPFNMNNEQYARDLRFFVPAEVNNFDKDNVLKLIPDSLQSMADVLVAEEGIQAQLRSWKKGCIKTVYVGLPGTPMSAINAVEKNILGAYSERGVKRVIAYNEKAQESFDGIDESTGMQNHSSSADDVISAHFYSLDSIRPFERFVKDVSELQIEMTQVNSKENFNAVSVMADILSVAMIIFSITSIIIFIVNMLQSYFQKVRRNLGTFKAFGISTRELTGVYVAIIICIILLALLIALSITWVTELLLPLFGLTMEGDFGWLVLWNSKTLWAVAIILIATVVSVLFVMRHQLRQTPGDLIYDRN